jgi:succinoglycan biosynthesis protein ExoM
MYKIAICVPTYKRPTLLAKLITTVLNSNIDKTLIKEIFIVIVDNDVDKSAEKIVNEFKKKDNVFFQLYYHSYPVKGLANIRNEIITRSLELDPDFIASIDDDEYATPDWLNEMLLTITSNHADAVIGPVIPVFESDVPESLRFHFTYHKITNNKRISFLETNNYIISVRFILEQKMRFDERFNFTGSEDNYFGVQALKKGARIFWAAKAVIYETIPTGRASLNWLIMRNYRSAITFMYVLLLEKDYKKISKKIATSVFYLCIGLPSLILFPFPSKFKYWGIIKISRALGGFAGLLNLKYYEYHKDLKAISD